MLLAVTLLTTAGSGSAQILPWEVTVAEIEAGRLRNLAERLSKQNLLYQYRLGTVRKADLIDTAEMIDRVMASLEKGSPTYSVPAPWTDAIRDQVARVDEVWGRLRRIAVASPYEYLRVSRDFLPAADLRGDPLKVRLFDDLARELIAESQKLQELYHVECVATTLGVCDTARTSGYAAMLIERVAKQAVFIVAGIDVEANRAGLAQTVEAYHAVRRANNESEFMAAALNPERGVSAQAAADLLASLRADWDLLQAELVVLEEGDERNFDLEQLLAIQGRLAAKVERLTAALVRYASLTFGS
jgi:hypothetical protein